MIWFTSDWHDFHKNIITSCNRPFEDVIEMHKTLIENYNSLVKPGDIVYYLGDLTFKNKKVAESTLKMMNGKIHFVLGNHDKKCLQILQKYCIEVRELMTITIFKQPIVLCHYAMRSWDRSHYGSWQLYGHSHGKLKPKKNQYDVGVDSNDFKPISFDQVKEKIEIDTIEESN